MKENRPDVQSRLLQRNIDHCELNFFQKLLCNAPVIASLRQNYTVAAPTFGRPDKNYAKPAAGLAYRNILDGFAIAQPILTALIRSVLYSICRRAGLSKRS
jgi:hypothetical protein